MSARDELARDIAIANEMNMAVWDDRPARSPVKYYANKQAEKLLAAGYRKPRTINAIEELHDLGRNAAVLAANGAVWVNDGDHAQPWASVVEDPQGGPVWTDGDDISLPAVVLHEVAA